MPKRRTRQRGGNCGLDHQTGGNCAASALQLGGRKSRRRRRRTRRKRGSGGKGSGASCTWLPMGSQCLTGLTCKSGTCQQKGVAGVSARTTGTVGSMFSGVSMPSLWGGKRRRRRRTRGRKSRGGKRRRKSRRRRKTRRRRR